MEALGNYPILMKANSTSGYSSNPYNCVDQRAKVVPFTTGTCEVAAGAKCYAMYNIESMTSGKYRELLSYTVCTRTLPDLE